MTLHLYFARRYFWAFLATFAVLGVISGLLDMLEQIRRYSQSAPTFFDVVRLTLLNLPSGLYQILPLITILASVFLFLNLARTSEMIVARASGRSALRTLAAPAAVALVLGAAAVAVLDPIAAATSKQYEAAANRYSGRAATLSLSNDALWLRQGGPDGQTVIRADSASLDGTQLKGVTFLGFDREGVPSYRIEAGEAELRPGSWHLVDAKRWQFDTMGNPERESIVEAVMDLPSDLTRDRIRDSFGTPSSIAVWDLPRFIRQLEAAGFSARSHRVWFQMELATPLMLMAMMLIGAGFTMRHTRLGGTGIMVLMALMTGFAIHFIRNFAQILGDRGQIPVELAAWAPPVAAVMLSIGILLHLEDG